MPNRLHAHWTAVVAIGLPLLVAGCAGTGTSQYSAAKAPPVAGAGAGSTSIMELADKLSDEQNYGNAAAMYKQAHENSPGDVRPLLGLGRSLLAVGANAEARDAYAMALEIEPNNLEALRGLGHARILLNQPSFAVVQYQTALKIAPKDTRSLNGLGVAQDMNGDHAAAQQTYKAVLAIDPDNQPARNNLALSMALSGNEAGAVKMLEEINRSPSATVVNRQNLALVYGVSGQLDAAERVSRADLPERQVARNMAALGASGASREALLKGALGVELKGVQYTPAPRPVVPLNNLALSAPEETPIYLSGVTGQELPLISSETSKSRKRQRSSGGALAAADDEDWVDDWNEELVDAADLDPMAPPQVISIQTAERPLPPSPKPRGAAAAKPPAAAVAPATMAKTGGTGEAAPAIGGPPPVAPQFEAAAGLAAKPDPAPVARANTSAAATTGKASPSDTPAKAPTPARAATPPAPLPAPGQPVVTVAATSGAAKMYTIQLASYRDEAEAAKGWQALTTDQGDLLAGLPHSVEKADLGAGKGIYFRLKAGAFDDIKAARSLCKDLKVRSVDCMVVEAAQPSAETPARVQQSMATPQRNIETGTR